jgi:hypothetical protein
MSLLYSVQLICFPHCALLQTCVSGMLGGGRMLMVDGNMFKRLQHVCCLCPANRTNRLLLLGSAGNKPSVNWCTEPCLLLTVSSH